MLEDTLTFHMIQAAKSLIPKKWKTKDAPLFNDWIRTVEEIREMEELTSIYHNNSQMYWKIWSPWIKYKEMLNMDK
ncbi:hypothetical protein XELAEV_18042243mg [Xenopus laevis]|uniref:Uncharacterized protein n=1 Tax=Xenopus laevis TaxID=8355 RepID=A0A974H5V3_XENLA|nr:hypothetical protein XELAEV_18042243mg [Xenopus laevis]